MRSWLAAVTLIMVLGATNAKDWTAIQTKVNDMDDIIVRIMSGIYKTVFEEEGMDYADKLSPKLLEYDKMAKDIIELAKKAAKDETLSDDLLFKNLEKLSEVLKALKVALDDDPKLKDNPHISVYLNNGRLVLSRHTDEILALMWA